LSLIPQSANRISKRLDRN